MAVNYNTLIQQIENSIDEEKIKKFEDYIDATLSQPGWLSRMRCGPLPNSNFPDSDLKVYRWSLTMACDDFTMAEKNELINRYVAADWDFVVVENSSRNEPGGLVCIDLFKYVTDTTNARR